MNYISIANIPIQIIAYIFVLLQLVYDTTVLQ